MLKDWGIKTKTHVWMDASAGIAIGSRRGLGKVKHIDTVFLWVQEVVDQKRVTIGKKVTDEMLADILTKPANSTTLEKMLQGMGYYPEAGRHDLGLRA